MKTTIIELLIINLIIIIIPTIIAIITTIICDKTDNKYRKDIFESYIKEQQKCIEIENEIDKQLVLLKEKLFRQEVENIIDEKLKGSEINENNII